MGGGMKQCGKKHTRRAGVLSWQNFQQQRMKQCGKKHTRRAGVLSWRNFQQQNLRQQRRRRQHSDLQHHQHQQ
jgi:hypothetical protein